LLLPPTATPFPYTTLFRSLLQGDRAPSFADHVLHRIPLSRIRATICPSRLFKSNRKELFDDRCLAQFLRQPPDCNCGRGRGGSEDRKSTRLNSSHVKISYA